MRRTEDADRLGGRFVNIRCGRKRLLWVLTLMAAGLVSWAASRPATVEQAQNPPGPYTLRTDGQQRTAIGLVYTPELLAALVARQPTESLNPRIADAVRQQTPIVVMWSVPIPPEVGPAPPPYKISIVERGDPTDQNGIEPVRIQQDATVLAQLDSRVRPNEVGAMAAFARAAFVPGRWICLYSNYPPDMRNECSEASAGGRASNGTATSIAKPDEMASIR